MKLVTSYTPHRDDPDLAPLIARLQLSSLPREPWPWVDAFVIVHRTLDEGRDVGRLARELRPLWPIEMLHRTPIAGVPPALQAYYKESVGFKVLLPLLTEPPFIWFDGDVVFTRDPSRHAAEGRPWASRMGIDRWFQDGSGLAAAIDHHLGFLVTKKTVTDAGVFHHDEILPGWYAQVLEAFFQIEAVEDIARYRARSRKAFFHLDQKFLSVWFGMQDARFINGGTDSSSGKMEPGDPLYFAYGSALRWVRCREAPKLPNSTFLHYNVSGHKREAVTKYTAWLDPDGGFLPKKTTTWKE